MEQYEALSKALDIIDNPRAPVNLDWPLVANNITHADKLALMEFLASERMPRLTNGDQVRAFEEQFAQWLGIKYAVMVNSGSSANLLSMQALAILHGPGRVLVPCITWVSDIAAVLHAGHTPVFVDVDPETLGMQYPDYGIALACFPTHCLGFNALPEPWTSEMLLIEDCCEALGAYHEGRKLGTRGWMSNFSFYYAHHLSTIEGGMICTDDANLYQLLRMLRSHGLVREMTDDKLKLASSGAAPDLDPEFIFTHPAYNVRPTELNAVIGLSQLKRLDINNAARALNLRAFLDALDTTKYRTRYATYGSSNYALPLVLQEPNDDLFARVLSTLLSSGVEYRKGTAGGGNQLRQPYAKARWGEHFHEQFPEAEHIHQYGLYLGNFPDLDPAKIDALTKRLNAL